MARGFAAVVVALRFLIPVAWVAGVVAATISLPQLGSEGGAPIGDIVPEHSDAEQATQTASERFGFPLATDTAVVQRNEAGLSPATQRRSFRAALATTRGGGPAPGELRGAIPITDASATALEAGGEATTMLTYLAFEQGLGGATRVDLAEQYADGGARRRVGRRRRGYRRGPGPSGPVRGDRRLAAPDRGGEHRRRPADRRDRLPLDRRAAGDSLHRRGRLPADDPAGPLGRRSARHRHPGRGRAGTHRPAPRLGHRLLGLLPVGDAPQAPRRGREAARCARCGKRNRASGLRGRPDRRGRDGGPAGRRARLLPRLRPRPRPDDPDQPAGRGHAGSSADGDLRRPPVRAAPAGRPRRGAGRAAAGRPGGVRGCPSRPEARSGWRERRSGWAGHARAPCARPAPARHPSRAKARPRKPDLALARPRRPHRVHPTGRRGDRIGGDRGARRGRQRPAYDRARDHLHQRSA